MYGEIKNCKEEVTSRMKGIEKFSIYNKIEHQKKEIQNEIKEKGIEKQVEILKAYLKSEETAEWVAASVVFKDSYLKADKTIKERMRSLLASLLSSKNGNNIHSARHASLTLFMLSPFLKTEEFELDFNFAEKQTSEKIRINPWNFFQAFLKNLERIGWCYILFNSPSQGEIKSFLQNYSKEILLIIDLMLEKLKQKKEGKRALLDQGRLSPEIFARVEEKFKEQESRLNQAKEDIKNKKLDLNFFREILPLFLRELKLPLADGGHLLLEQLDPWLAASLQFGFPYVKNDFNVNWKAVLSACIYADSDVIKIEMFSSKNFKIAYKKNMAFVLIHPAFKDLKELREEFCRSVPNRFIKAFQADTFHFFDFVVDYLMFLDEEEREKFILQLINKSSWEPSLQTLSQSLKGIFQVVKEPFSSYLKENMTTRLLEPYLISLSILSEKPSLIEKMLQYWHRLLILFLAKGDSFLLQSISRILKDLYYKALTYFKRKNPEKIDNFVIIHPSLYHIVFYVSKIAEKWGLSGPLEKDIGTMTARLIDLEAQWLKKEREGYFPWIFFSLLSANPEVSILEEAYQFVAYNEDVGDLLSFLAETLKQGELDRERFNCYQEFLRKIYGLQTDEEESEGFKIPAYVETYFKAVYMLKRFQTVEIKAFQEAGSKKQMIDDVKRKAETWSSQLFQKLQEKLKEFNRMERRLESMDIKLEEMELFLRRQVQLLEEIRTIIVDHFPIIEKIYYTNLIQEWLSRKKKLLERVENKEEKEIADEYKKLIKNLIEQETQDDKSSPSTLKFYEKWLFYHYNFKLIAEQKIKLASDIFKKAFLKFYILMISPAFVLSFLALPFVVYPFHSGLARFVLNSYSTFTILLLPSIVLLYALRLIQFLLNKYDGKLLFQLKKLVKIEEKSPPSEAGVSVFQLFLPRLFALIFVAANSLLLVDEVWNVDLNYGPYFFAVDLFLALLTFLFILSNVKRRVGERKGEADVESASKRAWRLFSLGLFQSIIIVLFNLIIVSPVMLERVPPHLWQGKSFLSIPFVIELKPLAAELIGKMFPTFSSPIKFPIWLFFSYSIKFLFIGVVLQMFLSKEELL